MTRSIPVLTVSLMLGCPTDAGTSAPNTPPSPGGASAARNAAAADPAGDGDGDGELPTTEVPAVSDDAIATVATSLNHFAVDLWPLVSGGGGNQVLSPLSIAIALSMVHAGAKGETAAEIARALHFEDDAEIVHGALAAMIAQFNASPEAVELSVVDRLFGERTIAFNRDYVAVTNSIFGAPLEPVDFRTGAAAARDRINGWVEDQTHDRIKDLLPANAVQPSTRLVLVNAIYFKAPWSDTFNQHLTQSEAFVGAGGRREVAMMHQQSRIHYAEHPEDKLKVAELSYAHSRYAMVVILPDDNQGLAAVEKSLDAAHLAKWTSKFGAPKVDLKLPKFKIEMPAPLLLSASLKTLGIRRAFDYTQADFSAMAPAAAQLEVSEGFHKAFIAVDEDGTEAAAATAIGMRAGAAPNPEPPKPFYADHPFLYLVRDTGTGALLFMGRVTDPKFEG